MVGIPRIQNLIVPGSGAARPRPIPATLPPASPAAAGPSNIQVFETSAAARAEVLRRDPTLEHAIGKAGDENFPHFYVITGTADRVSIAPGYDYYMHTHPGPEAYALPSFTDMCTFASQAQKRGVSYETMIYSTSSTHPGMCHLRWLDGRRFHLIYADGTRPSSPPTTPQFFGPTREFEVTIGHDLLDHRELVVTTRATATPLTYRFTEQDAISSRLAEQWFWGSILAGDSPKVVSYNTVKCSGLEAFHAISLFLPQPQPQPAFISLFTTLFPTDNNWFLAELIAFGLLMLESMRSA